MDKPQELKELLKQFQILELPTSTRTAADAASSLNCQLGQIAKSIVFKTITSKPILIIASGINRINEQIISELLKEDVVKADAVFVKDRTGFTIGGVAPVGHLETIRTFIDEDLFQYQEIWAAAGNPHAVFKLTPQQLAKITKGLVIRVK